MVSWARSHALHLPPRSKGAYLFHGLAGSWPGSTPPSCRELLTEAAQRGKVGSQ
jgi:hypothetical protein